MVWEKAMRACLCVAAFAALAAAQGTTKDFPPGWNGLARTPPMGWRSWNAFGARITQPMMIAAMDALISKVWEIDGKPNVSLMEAGYRSVGVDEGWEGCGQGINGTQHDANGLPVINDKFPDLKALVDDGHKRGLEVGWYLNGCACGEHQEVTRNYEGDIKLLHDFGFDGVKIDGCGAQVNMTFYAELMRASGRSYSIENCHWGHCGKFKDDPDGASCPTQDWCPFNWFRTSGDINAGSMSWFKNLQTVKPFLGDPPLSRPGCWAYPDMLEVGRVQGSIQWNRAHFGAWCIVSAPLVLGLDLTQAAEVKSIMPFVTNPEAIAVNQQWAGHPGRFVEELSETLQVWAKPQPGGAVAVLVINSGSAPKSVSVDLKKLGLSADRASVRSIWMREDLEEVRAKLDIETIPGMDSAFYVLHPATSTSSYYV